MIEDYFHHCLYFTAGKLHRIINKMAEEEFGSLGLSPTYVYLIMVVNEHNGISQIELCRILHLSQSTVTRFIDKLENKELVVRKKDAHLSLIHPTKKSLDFKPEIEKAWHRLYERYTDLLGEEAADELTGMIDRATGKLE